MDVSVLVTDGGPHPPDKWAALAARRIVDLVQIDEQSDSEAAATARKAKPRLAITLSDDIETYFASVMAAEDAGVASGSIAERGAPFDVSADLDAAVAAVTSAASPVFQHFADPEVQSVVRNILTQLFLDAANIQRSWAFDAKGL